MPRSTVEIPGFSHRNPVPAASRIGPFLFSGALTGRDPDTGELPVDMPAQVVNVFGHIRALMAAAGGSPDQIIKLTVHLADPADRADLNREWLRMFPDPADRPARHVTGARLGEGVLINCELVGVFE